MTPEKRKEYMDRLKAKNPEKWRKYYAEKAKEHYHKNKIEINERARKNPVRLFHTIKRNARYRNIAVSITKEEFVKWWYEQKQVCVYCDIPVERMAYVDKKRKLVKRLSVDRIDNEKGYENKNLALACLKCNFIKSNILSFDEMREIGQKYLKPKWLSKE